MYVVLFILILVFIICIYFHFNERSNFSLAKMLPETDVKGPVVLIPGLGGSILEAKWDISFSWYRFFCQREEEHWTQIWPSAFSAIPLENTCWANLIKTETDGTNINSSKGVDVRAKDFGGLSGINILDEVDLYLLNIPIVKYFEETTQKLKELGYDQLYGAPYDFRLIINRNYLDNYLLRLKRLIKEAWRKSGGEKVTLMSHSLGGPLTSYFINCQPKSWKDKYLKKFIAISGPFGGATQALASCLTGETEGIPVSKAFMKKLEKTYGGVIWMINEPNTWRNISMINGQGTNYIPQILAESGSPETGDLWINRALPIWRKTIENPNIETHLVYGSEVSTLFSLDYLDLNFDNPQYTFENRGDGTVPGISLESPVNVHGWDIASVNSLPGATHLGILNDKRWLDLIEKLMG